MKKLNILISLAAATAFAAFPAFAHEGHEDQAGEEVSVRGEVVDMACYIDHNATGPEHRRLREDVHQDGPASRHQGR